MLRLLLLAAAVCALAAGGSSAAAPPGAAADVHALLDAVANVHPAPYHATPQSAFSAAGADLVRRLPELNDDELLVGLMRLVAMLGERDGHAHLQPLDPAHRRTLHEYPLVVYGFADGIHVTAAPGRAELVGQRLVAVNGRPLDEILRAVDAVIPRDTEHNLRVTRTWYLLCAEVLHGLGLAAADRATFTFATTSGATTDVELTPLPASAFVAAVRAAYPSFPGGLPRRARPLFVSRRGTQQWLTTLDRGRVVYLAYNATQRDTWTTSQRLLRLVRRPKVRRIVVDLRNNGGGEIKTYPPLLDALRSRAVNRPGRLVVLIGPTTFSAAVHFASDVDRATRARFVGEPAGGSPNHYSDTGEPVVLPLTGYSVGIPRIYYEKRPGEPGLVLEPDVTVPQTAADFFAGRDPALALAIR